METTKSALRIQFLAQRRVLSADDVAQRSNAIANQFLTESSISQRINVATGRASPVIIHTFLPIVRQCEVDTWPIVHRVWQEHAHVQVAVSVMNSITQQLTHYPLTSTTRLIKNRWSIPEPALVDENPISASDLAIVLVPLLAFDRQGQRVGYGGGFYDRFLAECHPSCLKVGLSFFEPVERIIDVEPTDVRLNVCVTPLLSYWFK